MCLLWNWSGSCQPFFSKSFSSFPLTLSLSFLLALPPTRSLSSFPLFLTPLPLLPAHKVSHFHPLLPACLYLPLSLSLSLWQIFFTEFFCRRSLQRISHFCHFWGYWDSQTHAVTRCAMWGMSDIFHKSVWWPRQTGHTVDSVTKARASLLPLMWF